VERDSHPGDNMCWLSPMCIEAGKFDVPIGNVAKWRDLILKLHDSVLPTSASCLLYMCTPIIQTMYIVRAIS
jgi:hypothetical protein